MLGLKKFILLGGRSSNSSKNNVIRRCRCNNNNSLHHRSHYYYHAASITTSSNTTNPFIVQQQLLTVVTSPLQQQQQQQQQYRYYSNNNNSSFNNKVNKNDDFYKRNFSLLQFFDDNIFNMIQKPEKGTGFDNFLPKDNDNNNKQDEQQKHQRRNNTDPNNNNNNNNNNQNAWIALLFVLVVSYLTSSNSNDDEQVSGSNRDGGSSSSPTTISHREITWHDFLLLLQQNDIMKIVITEYEQQNQAQARIYIKPNATGLARTTTTSTTTTAGFPRDNNTHNTNNNNSNDSYYQQSQEQMDGVFHNESNNVTNAIPNTMSTSSNTGNLNKIPFFYYRLPIGSIESFERKLDEAQRALGRSSYDDVPVQYTAESNVRELLGIIPGLFLAAMMYGMMRYGAGGIGASGGGRGGSGGGGAGGIFSIGKSTAKKIEKHDVNITFANVAGCDEAKKEIMEFVDFLKDSDRFTKLGAKIPKGALLCGPPGTGKTLLAKAVAGEAGVPFYTISGSDFIEMFVGVGPSRVRDLFQEARSNAPCIVFIDEIDAVGRQRGRGGIGGNDERENTLNQLLVEMDGFNPSTGVVVLAGTNRVDILDQALTRPGRFDRQIVVDKPDLKGRKEIFKVHLQGITLQDDINDVAGRLAGLTPGFAGADIANICNEAAIVAARRKANTVSMDDFEKATDRIIGGLESNKIMSTEERSIVAHHEAGHAVAGWFLQHADPLLKVTIIPRSNGALGFAQYLPKEVFLRTQEQIMDIVCTALAGRAAEEIFFGRVTTGASDDLKRVTQLVYSTIQLYGMNTKLGQLSFPKDPNALYDDRPYSEKTAKVMDEEAKIIVDDAYKRTLDLLNDKKEYVAKLAKALIEKETITHDDIINIIGKRPFQGDPAYEEFVRRRQQDKEKKEEEKKEESSNVQDDTTTSNEGGLNPGLA